MRSTRRRLLQRALAAVAGAPAAGWPLGSYADDAPPPRAPDDATPKAPVKTGSWEHALAAYTAPKYARGFTHFEYVNPDAPKGGVLRLRNPDRRSSFDKFNPFTVRGNAPAGLTLWMFESLTYSSQDEPMAMYGLLAEEMHVAPDMSSVSFRLNPAARFHTGEPVMPQDVVHSFKMLTSKEANPAVQLGYSGIESATAVDSRTVRFDLRERKMEHLFTAGGLPVFSRKWGEGKKFDEIVSEYPITSGPYTIERVDIPRRIEFKRNPEYWAKDLGVRRGHFNFERVIYRMYLDQAVAREAFKAGEFDIFKEYGGRSWMRQHKGVKWDDGRIVKRQFETSVGHQIQSFQLNLRRPMFQDMRVREALGYTYDFETGASKYPFFKRANSVFNNSPFAAQGLPSPGELKLLEPFRAELPERVFGPAFVAPRTDGDPDQLRRNLLKARELFEQAGWKLAADGKLRNEKGDVFGFEYLNPSEGQRNTDWERNLVKLGIDYRERNVDFALYRRRLENYDFDVVTIVEGTFTLPSASDLQALYGSKSAEEKGNSNYRGVKSKAMDRLIEVLGDATTMQELQDAARAIDRVVMWSFWQVPDLYGNTENASYWNKFGIPKVQAKYFTIDTGSGFGPWPLWCWWDKSLGGQG
jgi:peptide/nickel transport system substrate-binding protein/microcin C transport system substrate-binding protein